VNEDAVLTSYHELAAVLDSLPLLVREARRARRLSLRRAAAEMAVNATTIHRTESGEAPSVTNAVKMLRWLGTTP
jgi:ribosome-binding protein aMBF1 (putative translation factor)